MEQKFDERAAILFEMEELKWQARKDFEIYMDSKQHRAARYAELQDRLRDIDRNVPRETIPVEEPAVSAVPLAFKHFPVTKEEVVKDNIRKAMLDSKPAKPQVKKGKKIRVSADSIEKHVVDYLEWRGESKLKDIQSYVESKVGREWVNFSTPMIRLVNSNERVISRGSGMYAITKEETE